MRIEWLNEERSRAVIMCGWFWKRRAEVYQNNAGGHWRYLGSHQTLPLFRQALLDWRRARDLDWQPVAKLPAARVRR